MGFLRGSIWELAFVIMVLLTMTPTMVEAVQAYKASPPSMIKDSALSSEPSLENATKGNPISDWQIIEISKHLQEQVADKQYLNKSSEKLPSYSLDRLLRGSRVYIASPVPKAEPVEILH